MNSLGTTQADAEITINLASVFRISDRKIKNYEPAYNYASNILRKSVKGLTVPVEILGT